MAANVAVAEPILTSRVIAAWPSFALIGSYELSPGVAEVSHGVAPEYRRGAFAARLRGCGARHRCCSEVRSLGTGPVAQHLWCDYPVLIKS